MIGQREALRLAGCDAFDPLGHRIGIVGRIYLDETTEQPAWVTVQSGLFGTNESFVPLDGAAFDGDTLTVAVHRETVRQAPRPALDQKDLDPEQEMKLYLHYGMEYGVDPGAPSIPEQSGGGREEPAAEYAERVRPRLRRWMTAT